MPSFYLDGWELPKAHSPLGAEAGSSSGCHAPKFSHLVITHTEGCGSGLSSAGLSPTVLGNLGAKEVGEIPDLPSALPSPPWPQCQEEEKVLRK